MNVRRILSQFSKSLIVCLALACSTMTFANEGEAAKKPATTQEKAAQSGAVSINTATSTELESLPRIGRVMAQRIIDFRTEHGPFKSLDELMNVKGIGEKTFANLKAHIKL